MESKIQQRQQRQKQQHGIELTEKQRDELCRKNLKLVKQQLGDRYGKGTQASRKK